MNHHVPIGIEEYHGLAMSISPKDGHDKIDNGVLGLIYTTGKMVGMLRNHLYRNKTGAQFPRHMMMYVLEDVLWNLEELADGLGTQMSKISSESFEDLHDRTHQTTRAPTLHKAILNLSSHANKIRRSVERVNYHELEIQMRRMLFCCAWLARICGYTISEVAQNNIQHIKGGTP